MFTSNWKESSPCKHRFRNHRHTNLLQAGKIFLFPCFNSLIYYRNAGILYILHIGSFHFFIHLFGPGAEGTHTTVCLWPTYKRGWQTSGSQGSTYLCVPSCGIESVPGIRLSTPMTAPLPRPDLVLLIP